MNVFDIFNRPEFSANALTEAVNIKPNMYGRLDELGLFPFVGKPTTYVEVEFNEGRLRLLTTKERGAPPTENGRGKRTKRQIPMFHVPQSDKLMADDIQNAVQFGSENALENVASLLDEKLDSMRDNHHITHEFMRWGALAGELIDADGGTLIDFYDEFGIVKPTMNFALDVGATKVSEKCRALSTEMERRLKGETMRYIHVMASPEWFEDFIGHESVAAAYDKYASEQEPMRKDVRKGFVHQDILFEQHIGEATFTTDDGAAVNRKFIPAGEAIAFPVGTRQVFRHYGAPADRLSEVNRVGQDIYMWQHKDRKDRWLELESQANPLFINQRPELVYSLSAA